MLRSTLVLFSNKEKVTETFQTRTMSFTDIKLIILITESGLDPAEWAARQEDRFYNNKFKDTEV